jgi:hypothetical protein
MIKMLNIYEIHDIPQGCRMSLFKYMVVNQVDDEELCAILIPLH